MFALIQSIDKEQSLPGDVTVGTNLPNEGCPLRWLMTATLRIPLQQWRR